MQPVRLDPAMWQVSCPACMQVADANSPVRQQLCFECFSLLKQLESEKLSAAAKAVLLQQVDEKLMQTQFRSVLLCVMSRLCS